MRKWIALLLALSLVCLCGCGTNQNETAQTNPPAVQTEPPQQTEAPDLQMVGLSVWVVAEDIWADTGAMDAILEEFNAYYPNILVTVEHRSPEELNTAKPDLVLANAEQIAEWYAEGGMAELSDLWANGLKGDVYEAAQEVSCTEAGAYHTVPLCLIPYCMAVNTDMFSDADAMNLLNTANHTWNTGSFLKAVQAVYDNGTDTVGTVYCKDMQEDMQIRMLAESMYGGSFVEKKTGAYSVSEGNMGKALSALAAQEGIVFDKSSDADAAREQFLAGETAFVLNWNGALQVKYADRGEILFMNYPSSASVPETSAEVYGLGIFDNGDPVKVAASKTFLAYVSNDPAAVRATRNLPARESYKDAFDGTDLEKTMDELAKLVNYLTDKETPSTHWDSARSHWLKMLQSMEAAGEEWQTVLDETQKNLNALFPELFPPETETTEPTE